MKVCRWNQIKTEQHNNNVFSRRYYRLGKLSNTYAIDFETSNPAQRFDKFIRRNKPISSRRVVSFLKWEQGTQFVRNFYSLPINEKYVCRFCGMRHYGKELIELIDKRVKSFPSQTDYELANKLKLTIEKTFNL